MQATNYGLLNRVEINITSRTMTFVDDHGNKRLMEFDSVDSFVARREFIEQNKVGFSVIYSATVE
jgi:hypothetical protein